MRASMSVVGLYNYDNSIFDGLTVPTGMDKNLLVSLILQNTFNISCVYFDPVFLKDAITAWSSASHWKWDKLYKATQFEYNPIENYDRKESYTNKDIGTISSSGDGTSYATAFNSDDDKKTGKSVSAGTSTQDLTHTVDGSIHGNIGVTTTQQMIMSEREVSDYSIYMVLVEDFKHEFCVLVY
nr:MAG TPA: Portal protein, Proximal tail tube, phi29, mature virion, VIRUS.3A [Caudoviricetes sp.]